MDNITLIGELEREAGGDPDTYWQIAQRDPR